VGKNNGFIYYLLRNKLENFIFFLGFVFAIAGYTLWKPLGILLNLTDEQSYSIFYVCIAVSFFCYTFAYYLTKYHKWRWFPMFVYLICGSRVVLEITRPEDSQTFDLIEYGMFVLTIFIVFCYYIKFRYKKYNEENNNNNNTD